MYVLYAVDRDGNDQTKSIGVGTVGVPAPNLRHTARHGSRAMYNGDRTNLEQRALRFQERSQTSLTTTSMLMTNALAHEAPNISILAVGWQE